MRNSEYLYGGSYDPKMLRNMTYPQALLQKIIWAKQITDLLLTAEVYDRDFVRINKVGDSIRFNTALYDECIYGMGNDA